MLACFRIGAVALPCNTQLRGGDLAHRVEVAKPGARDRRGRRCSASCRRGRPRSTSTSSARSSTRSCPQEPPAEPADLDPGEPALIVFTSGTTGEARAAVHSAALPARAEAAGGALVRRPRRVSSPGAPRRRGWSKSARNAFIAPWLCGAAALIHERPLRPRRAARDLRARGRQRPLPGADRVPDAGQADRAAAAAGDAPARLRRRAAQPRGDPRVPRGHGARDPRRLRPDRDRRADRRARRRERPRRVDGQAAARHRAADRRG